MLAEIGKTYAQVLDGKCHWIFTSVELPEWNENDIETVDITGKDVKVGDIFIDGIFSTPVPVVITDEELAVTARATRDKLLAKTDWTQTRDVPQALSDKWASYRQALRDVPLQSGFPQAIVWPTMPA